MTKRTNPTTLREVSDLNYTWGYRKVEWDTFPSAIEQLEKEGWEIFGFLPTSNLGESQRTVAVIYRKPRADHGAIQLEKPTQSTVRESG